MKCAKKVCLKKVGIIVHVVSLCSVARCIAFESKFRKLGRSTPLSVSVGWEPSLWWGFRSDKSQELPSRPAQGEALHWEPAQSTLWLGIRRDITNNYWKVFSVLIFVIFIIKILSRLFRFKQTISLCDSRVCAFQICVRDYASINNPVGHSDTVYRTRILKLLDENLLLNKTQYFHKQPLTSKFGTIINFFAVYYLSLNDNTSCIFSVILFK